MTREGTDGSPAEHPTGHNTAPIGDWYSPYSSAKAGCQPAARCSKHLPGSLARSGELDRITTGLASTRNKQINVDDRALLADLGNPLVIKIVGELVTID